MAKKQLWQDDYWLLLLQVYLKKPVGMKSLYNRELVDLSLELHIAPQVLHEKMEQIATLETPRVERIWKEYGQNPAKLSRAVKLLRQMAGFNSGGDFFEGVNLQETFERDFRPIADDKRLTPVMLILILDEYFRLTPATMVAETPEVQQLSRLLQLPIGLILEVLRVYQSCDPYFEHREVPATCLLRACREVWRRYGNNDVQQLAAYADQLKEYFKR